MADENQTWLTARVEGQGCGNSASSAGPLDWARRAGPEGGPFGASLLLHKAQNGTVIICLGGANGQRRAQETPYRPGWVRVQVPLSDARPPQGRLAGQEFRRGQYCTVQTLCMYSTDEQLQLILGCARPACLQ